ncbi:unnamed protein product, partial [Cuscuta europaea]
MIGVEQVLGTGNN